MKVIFSGQHARAFLIERKSDRVVATFDHLVVGKTGFTAPVPSAVVERAGASQLIVQCAANDMFLNADLMPLTNACAALAASFRQVICYGYSMGAYAAMMFSGPLKADRVVCISPQFSMDPKKVPFETRWADLAKNLNHDLDDLWVCIAKNADGFLIYDSQIVKDELHIGRIVELCPHWHCLPMPGAGHPASKILLKGRQFAPFMVHALSERADFQTLRAIYERAATAAKPPIAAE